MISLFSTDASFILHTPSTIAVASLTIAISHIISVQSGEEALEQFHQLTNIEKVRFLLLLASLIETFKKLISSLPLYQLKLNYNYSRVHIIYKKWKVEKQWIGNFSWIGLTTPLVISPLSSLVYCLVMLHRTIWQCSLEFFPVKKFVFSGTTFLRNLIHQSLSQNFGGEKRTIHPARLYPTKQIITRKTYRLSFAHFMIIFSIEEFSVNAEMSSTCIVLRYWIWMKRFHKIG